MVGHPEATARFVADDDRLHWQDQAVWWVRQKRDTTSAVLADWEALRGAAAAIKRHVLSRLADYLEEFERNATALGRRCTGRPTRQSTTRSCTCFSPSAP